MNNVIWAVLDADDQTFGTYDTQDAAETSARDCLLESPTCSFLIAKVVAEFSNKVVKTEYKEVPTPRTYRENNYPSKNFGK